MYGGNADAVQNLITEAYPDMGKRQFHSSTTFLTIIPSCPGWATKLIGYGMVYGQTDILTQVETSCVLTAAIIGMDTPRQFQWHFANIMHGGGSVEQATAVRQICLDVADRAGFKWKNTIPSTPSTVA